MMRIAISPLLRASSFCITDGKYHVRVGQAVTATGARATSVRQACVSGESTCDVVERPNAAGGLRERHHEARGADPKLGESRSGECPAGTVEARHPEGLADDG